MKWKDIYKDSLSMANAAMHMLIGVLLVMSVKNRENMTQPSYDFVPVYYVQYSDVDYNGQYDIENDQIFINSNFEPDTYYTIAHELKHSHNAQVFSYQINTDANELSARFAATLARSSVAERRNHVLDSLSDALPHSAMIAPMDEMAMKRFPQTQYMDAIKKLRTEKQSLIDSIARRFDGAIRDSLINDINDKYAEKPRYITEYEQIMTKMTRPDKNVFERDLNYAVGDLQQRDIDSFFFIAMEDYRRIRSGYTAERLSGIVHAQFRPMTDAELEKLFTFKINGVHRSLFKEASPRIQNQVRRMANADNLMMQMKFALGRKNRDE